MYSLLNLNVKHVKKEFYFIYLNVIKKSHNISDKKI